MLLKALFTILAILWIIQALRPYLGGVQQGPNLRYKQPPPKNDRKDDDDEGEYIDYEEIK
ncbi:MAG: hypothetical protein R3D58_18525 [Saprospiraceae bacterium]|jgi:hypothetical protein|nr:hypothetical protein [Lewinellaceae bacterium]